MTLPPFQPVADLRLHRLQLLSAVVRLCCVMVGMRLAAASWQSTNCLLRYSCNILTKMCCMAVLEWAGSFQTPFRTPFQTPFQTRTSHVPPLTHSPVSILSYVAMF